MDNWLQKPWIIRVVSLILAILLFITVSLQENASSSNEENSYPVSGSEQVEVLNDVPVSFEIAEEYVVSGIPETVTVTVEGPTSALLPLVRQPTFNVFVDLSGLGPGIHQVDLQYTGIPEEMNVQLQPSTVEVVIEERATEEYEVSVDYINPSQIVSGFEVGESSVEPDTVSVTSSESVIERIAVVKAYINLKGVDSPIIDQEVPVKVYDSQGNELDVQIEPEVVEVSVEVLNPSKEVPVEIDTAGALPEGLTVDAITVEPENVTLYATEEVLTGIEEVLTEEINLSNITETTTMEVSLDLPPEIRVAEPELAEVTVEVEEMEVAMVEEVPVRVENLPSGLKAAFLEPENGRMNIRAMGTREELAELSAADIELVVDAADAREGEVALPVQVRRPRLLVEPEYNHIMVRVD